MSSPLKTLYQGEEIQDIIRPHWGKYGKQILITVLIMLPPLLFANFFFQSQARLILFAIIELVGFSYGLFYWLERYLNRLVVTNRRIVFMEQKNIFHKSVTEVLLENIANITYDMKGIGANIARYGNLQVHASTFLEPLEIPNLYDPEDIRMFILEAQEERLAQIQRENGE